ncbi:MAG: AAA family ATPase [Planctomycetaceae bacterium]
MKLTQIDIERFGIWRDLSLPVSSTGLTVLYGPNEAGKTTLLRFIRSMLYGASSHLPDRPHGLRKGMVSHLPWTGSVNVEHEGQPYQIRRAATSDSHTMLSIHGMSQEHQSRDPSGQNLRTHVPDQLPDKRLLGQMHHGIGETLFQQLYAIGLSDLQELATWDDQTVAAHIYSLTLGSSGSVLLNAHREAEAMKKRLVHAMPKDKQHASPDAPDGEINRLLKRHAELTHRLDEQSGKLHRYREVVAECDVLHDQISEMKSRRSGLDSQLRGHQFMDRIWGPWSRLEKLKSEWRKIPRVKAFPEDGLTKLVEFERERDSAQRCRDSIRAEIERHRTELKACIVPRRLVHFSDSIRRLHASRQRIEGIAANLPVRQYELTEEKQTLQSQLRDLEGNWTAERLFALDNLAEHAGRLHSAAGEYRMAVFQRNRLRNRLQRQLKKTRRERMLWKERLPLTQQLTPEQGLKQSRRRRQHADELCRNAHLIEALEQRNTWTMQMLSVESKTADLPEWGWWAVSGFTAFGIFLFIAGLFTGWWQSWLAGTIFCLLAFASASAGWAIRTHFRTSVSKDQEALLEEHMSIKNQLNELLERQRVLRNLLAKKHDHHSHGDPHEAHREHDAELYQIVPDETISDTAPIAARNDVSADESVESDTPSNGEEAEIDPWDLLREADLQVQEWGTYAAWHSRWLQQRKSLSERRTRFQELQRDLSTRRREWCDALGDVDLPETLDIAVGLTGYQRLLTAAHTARKWKQLDDGIRHDEHQLASFLQQTQRLKHLIEGTSTKPAAHIPPPPSQHAAAPHHAKTVSLITVQEALHLLSEWMDDLHQTRTHRRERRRLMKEIRLKRREEAEDQQLMQEYQTQAHALMVQGGAANRDEFERRSRWARRRAELRSLLAEAKETLAEAARTEPDLAVVESDLLQFKAEENAECIRTVEQELVDLDDDLNIGHQELGQLQQELKSLASDRTSASLRREREQVIAQIRKSCIDWCALDWARQSLECVQEQFEQTAQPETLKFASNYLQRLTDGRYRRIWTALGEHKLYVDDAGGQGWMIEQLSNGTREQVFLAVRLALVSRLAEQGVELPMVLDDVLVNFDEQRTQAAVRLLADYASAGQQVLLLTCHSHIADAFNRLGVPPLQLRGTEHPLWERQAG